MLVWAVWMACGGSAGGDSGYDIADNPCTEGLWPGEATFTVYRFSIDDVDHAPTAGLACRTARGDRLSIAVTYEDAAAGVVELTVPSVNATHVFGEDDLTARVTKGELEWTEGTFATGGTVQVSEGFVDDVTATVLGDAASNSGVLRLTLDAHVGSPAAWSGGGGTDTETGTGGDDTGGWVTE